ncbi:MAG TPA: hypothetical protein VGM60_13770 [Pseudonocardia sp.]|jgi:hypothetical protein
MHGELLAGEVTGQQRHRLGDRRLGRPELTSSRRPGFVRMVPEQQ